MLASIPVRTLNPIRSRRGIPRFSLFGKCSKRHNRPMDALEHEFAGRFRAGQRLDRGMHFAVDEDLAAACLATQSRSEVHDRANGCIIESPRKQLANKVPFLIECSSPKA